MKNITALKVLVIIIISFSLPYTAHCQETGKRNYGFSLGTQFGLVHGKALEYVYNPPNAGREIFSELIWEMKPVFYYGFLIDFGRVDPMSRPGFFASVSFKAGVPADSGVMEDRDWLSASDAFTHFSSSNNKTLEFFWLDAAAGASIPLAPYLYIKPFISGSWKRFSFAARDGYFIYPSGTGSFEGEEVCNYKQDWFLIAAGISAGTNILYPFSFDVSFQISPLTYCRAVDEHLKRITLKNSTLIFMDYTGFGLFLEPRGRFSFNAEQLEFSLEAAWRFTGKTRGKSYDNYYGGFSAGGEAGAGLSFIDTRLIVKLRI